MTFNNLSIRRKLTWVIMLTSTAVLFVMGTAFLTYEFLTSRREIIEYTDAFGNVLATSSAPALMFHDPNAAAETLEVLREERYIAGAALYDDRDRLFASYPPSGSESVFPVRPEADGYVFRGPSVLMFKPVTLDQKRYGTLYLKGDLTPLYGRLERYAGIVALFLGGSLLVALGLSTFLQRRISEPILALANLAHVVSDRKDYSVRAEPAGRDELGVLTDAFNHMLLQIETRDTALREKEERLRLALEGSHMGIWDWNVATNRVTWDDYVHDLFGMAPGTFAGTYEHFLERVCPADQPGVREAVDRSLREGNDYRAEYRVILPTGQVRYLSTRAKVFRNARGRAERLTGVVLDATDSKRAEEEIRQLNADLEGRVRVRTAELTEINKELEAFTYSVAHDLRAPLRHLDGFAQIVQEEYAPQLPPEARRFLSRIRASAQNLGRLVDALLNLARVGRRELNILPTDLNRVLAEVIAGFKSETGERHIDWRIARLPEVACDPDLMRQVYANLIANALKYTRPRPLAVVEVGQCRMGTEDVLFVRDNGVGFNMKYVNKLFGVFQRLHRLEEFEGTGIGLATVERIVHKHHGRVWAEAAPDEGATFYFTLGSPESLAA